MQFRRIKLKIDGVLLLDKPPGLSSNHALQRVKHLFSATKAGHTGTLDPMATGLLPLTFGEATKFSQLLLDADKTYEATVRLGVITDTGDAEGVVLDERPVDVTNESIARALKAFCGEIEQIPPMFSALKRDGKPLYEYARAGIELERTPRRVTLRSIELIEPLIGDSFRVRVCCSKGTYIRSFAMDLGMALGCGAHLSALCRTQIGPFSITQSTTIATLEGDDAEVRRSRLLPVDALVFGFRAHTLGAAEAEAILHGRTIRINTSSADGLVRLYAMDRFIGLGECRNDGSLVPKRLVASS